MTVPIIDLADEAGAVGQIAAAAEEIGFMAIRHPHADWTLVERAFDSARHFFDRDAAAKSPFAYTDPAANFGYQAMRSEHLDPGEAADLKEAFTMRAVLQATNAEWPDAAFQRVATAMYRHAFELALDVARLFSIALGEAPDFIGDSLSGRNVTMRYLHYPAVEAAVAGQQGAGAHTDYGAITLLFQDGNDGLEVKTRDGTWLAVPCIPETIVINTGDLMTHWTNGRYPSTLHRVPPQSRARQSLAFFVDPDDATPVTCLPRFVDAEHPRQFTDTTAGEHILARIAASLKGHA